MNCEFCDTPLRVALVDKTDFSGHESRLVCETGHVYTIPVLDETLWTKIHTPARKTAPSVIPGLGGMFYVSSGIEPDVGERMRITAAGVELMRICDGMYSEWLFNPGVEATSVSVSEEKGMQVQSPFSDPVFVFKAAQHAAATYVMFNEGQGLTLSKEYLSGMLIDGAPASLDLDLRIRAIRTDSRIDRLTLMLSTEQTTSVPDLLLNKVMDIVLATRTVLETSPRWNEERGLWEIYFGKGAGVPW